MYQFRNLSRMCLSLDAKEILLVGKNGAGKSNFLEAIHYLCLGSSFRERQDEHVIAFDKDRFGLRAKHAIHAHFDTLQVQYEYKKKEITLNQVILRDRKELLLRYPCVVFGYHDMALIYGEPSLKRQFFDQVASVVYSDSYILLLRQYQHLLKQRNSAFKNQNQAFIDASEEIFIEVNWRIIEIRKIIMEQFNERFSELSETLFKKRLFFHYMPSLKGDIEREIGRYLSGKRSYEWQKKSTLFGIHRDRYILMESDREIASYLSIGQKRMASLIMKQVLTQLIVEHHDHKPILLLDDVFVELDESHKEAFWQLLPPYEQLFMSELPGQERSIAMQSAKVYYIESGQVYLERKV